MNTFLITYFTCWVVVLEVNTYIVTNKQINKLKKQTNTIHFLEPFGFLEGQLFLDGWMDGRIDIYFI